MDNVTKEYWHNTRGDEGSGNGGQQSWRQHHEMGEQQNGENNSYQIKTGNKT